VIEPLEIFEYSRELGLGPELVEKDYIADWFLQGVFSHSLLKHAWTFKGGACLRKCYFETYRFSGDLDFAVNDSAPGHTQSLLATLGEVADWIYEGSGIEIPRAGIKIGPQQQHPAGITQDRIRIGYRGPLHRRGTVSFINVNLTTESLPALGPVEREAFSIFSDRPNLAFPGMVCCFEELLAAKVLELASGMRAHDLYDVVQMYRGAEKSCDYALVTRLFNQKNSEIGLAAPCPEWLRARPGFGELEMEWNNVLWHQLPYLPPMDAVLQELPALFSRMNHIGIATTAPLIPMDKDEDPSWDPPASVVAWGLKVPLEPIRFAASNRLCVRMTYRSTVRLVEPYGLRRTRGKRFVLRAICHKSGEPLSCAADLIEAASPTDISFVPHYAIEMAPSRFIPSRH
jgi:hypothetical protein